MMKNKSICGGRMLSAIAAIAVAAFLSIPDCGRRIGRGCGDNLERFAVQLLFDGRFDRDCFGKRNLALV